MAALPSASCSDRPAYCGGVDSGAVAWGAGVDVAGTVKIAGNKDAPGPADPCPWPNDGECDEMLGLCVAGSDVEDCM